MTSRYCCANCLARQDDEGSCGECGGEVVVDLHDESISEDAGFVDDLRVKIADRRRKFVFVMEAMAIAFCAGILFVGLTIAEGLGGGLVSWAAKAVAVVLLAALWVSIPRLYDRHLRGRPSRLLAEINS